MNPFEQAALIVEGLPVLVREKMDREHLTYRQADRESGVDDVTIMRVVRGEGVRSATVLALLRWLAS